MIAALVWFLLRRKRRSHRDDFDDSMVRCLISSMVEKLMPVRPHPSSEPRSGRSRGRRTQHCRAVLHPGCRVHCFASDVAIPKHRSDFRRLRPIRLVARSVVRHVGRIPRFSRIRYHANARAARRARRRWCGWGRCFGRRRRWDVVKAAGSIPGASEQPCRWRIRIRIRILRTTKLSALRLRTD